VCIDHQTEVRLGWELEQTSDEDNDITYWTIRLYPYAYGELDWRPFMSFNIDDFVYYSEIKATVEDFQAGVFVEGTAWWDWSTTTATRMFCYGAGYAVDTITFAFWLANHINDCYKTILDDLEDPGKAFTNKEEDFLEWSYCEESDEVDVPIFEYSFFDESADQEVYWVGETPAQDASTGCTAALFTGNPWLESAFDIYVN
jgi:hypothetical protein